LTGGRPSRLSRPTQADVARLAKVSQATVSYVLNGNPAISVPEVTRRRILTAVDELGYVPNGIARSLRTQRTYMIAAVIPDITNPFYPAFERGIQETAEASGYDLIVLNTGGTAEKEQRCVRALQQGRVDGVVGVFFHLKAEDLRPLLERNVALVRLEAVRKGESSLDLPLDNLYVDNVAASRTAVEHLIGRGHARIGMIAGQRGPRQARVSGYRAALGAHGLPLDESLIRDGDFSEDGGRYAMQSLLDGPRPPTAVFAASDVMAMGALVAIREAGLAVPENIAVVGFDDIPVARLITPRLTTVAPFQENLGVRAAEMLLERLNGTAPEHGRSEEMPYKLIVRESA
jgi:LacI family transcriptional regulator, galactose operon repressor